MLGFSKIALSLASLTFASAAYAARPGSIEEAITKLDAEWVKAAASHDLNKTVSYYAPDAVMLAPYEKIHRTPKSIKASWAPLCDKSTKLKWKSQSVKVAKAGDLAYSIGTYDLTIKLPDGKSQTDHGKFLEIWKKQKSGSWKCVADMFNSDIPIGS